MVRIHARPSDVEERLVPGHGEGDFIKGALNRSAVGTLVERTTVFTVLSRMDDARAELALSGFRPGLHRSERQTRLSLTDDQGRERAAHHRWTDATGVTVYFADPHRPWPRGLNEHPHGLVRPSLPQGSDGSGFTQDERDAMAWTLNTRPRQSLGVRVSRRVGHEDLPGCPARKSGEEWQPIAKRRQIPSWFTKAPPGRAGFFTPGAFDCRPHHAALVALGT